MKAVLFFFLIIPALVQAQSANELISQGNQYYKQTQYGQAEAAYRQALQADPASQVAAYNLANALQKQKKYEEAVQVLEKLHAAAIDARIKSESAYNQGVAFTKMKNLDPSIEAYKKALRINPNDVQARENLQKALLEKKKQQQDQQQQQKSSSSMSEKDAEQKLKQLQEKERQLQQKIQSQKKQQGGRDGKDW
jgi:Ca-activated chloride channel homolog